MSRTIYLCTCKDAYDEEKLCFPTQKQAEFFLKDCIDYAFEEEEVTKDKDGYTKEQALNNWGFSVGDYSAQIETVELFD